MELSQWSFSSLFFTSEYLRTYTHNNIVFFLIFVYEQYTHIHTQTRAPCLLKLVFRTSLSHSIVVLATNDFVYCIFVVWTFFTSSFIFVNCISCCSCCFFWPIKYFASVFIASMGLSLHIYIYIFMCTYFCLSVSM